MNTKPTRAASAVPSRRVVLGFFGVVLLTLAAYRDIAQHEFLNYDDNEYVTEHPVIRRGLHWEGLLWAVTHFHHATWHPLTTLSHMLDCSVFGLDAPAHLRVNLFLHLANTGLLFWLFYRTTGAPGPSLWIAGAFALHPLHVESVAWVAERKDVLSTLFGLLSSLAYVRYAWEPTRGRYVAALLCFVLALLSKPMVVTLPLLWLLLDWWPLRRVPAAQRDMWSRWRFLVFEKLPFLLCSLVIGLVTIATQQRAGALEPLAESPLPERLSTAAVALVAYLRDCLWPARLAVFYPRQPIALVSVAGSLALLGSLTALAIRYRHRAPYVFVGWLWYLFGILPVSGLIQVGDQARADRFTYLPLVGIFLAVAFLVREWARAGRLRQRGVVVVAAAILLVWTCVSANQVEVWRNSQTLFRHALRVTQANHVAHANLGADLLSRGSLREARQHLHAALRLRPALPLALISLGVLEEREGNLDVAADLYQRVLALNPNHVTGNFNLALLLRARGDREAALRHVQRAIEVDASHAKAQVLLGDLLWERGDADGAITAYRRAIAGRPDLVAAHNQLALALEGSGRREEAIEFYRNVVRLAPEDPRAHFNLGAALKDLGHAPEAEASFQMALTLAEAQGAANIARAAREALADRSAR